MLTHICLFFALIFGLVFGWLYFKGMFKFPNFSIRQFVDLLISKLEMGRTVLFLIGLIIFVMFTSNALIANQAITWMDDEWTSISEIQYLGDTILFEIQSYPSSLGQGAQVHIDWQNDGYAAEPDENVDWYDMSWLENVGNNSKWQTGFQMLEIGTHNRRYLGWAEGQGDYITDWQGEFVVSPIGLPRDFIANKDSSDPSNQINLSWQRWGHPSDGSKDVLIVARAGGDLTAHPVNGETYNAGDALGDGKVIYRGSLTSFTHNDENEHLPVQPNTTYYYRIYTENWSYYSSEVSANAQTDEISGDIAIVRILSPENNYRTDADNITVSGSTTNAQAGDTVAIYNNDDYITTITLQEAGTFSHSVSLNPGQNIIKAELHYDNSQKIAVHTRTVIKSQELTFYFKGPDWKDNIPSDPQVMLKKNDTDVVKTMSKDNNEWWIVSFDVFDITEEFTYQVRFSQGGDIKYQHAYENFGFDPKYTTTTGEIWINATTITNWQEGTSNFYLHSSRITDVKPTIIDADPSGKPSWVQDAIVYNVLVDRFVDGDPTNNTAGQTGGIESAGGDLQGVIKMIKNNYFQNLGVTMLYLSPVYPVHEPDTTLPDQGGWLGFDPVDMYDVRQAYGGMETMDKLIQLGLENNIKIILDQPRFFSWNTTLFRNLDGSLVQDKIDDGWWRIWYDEDYGVYRSSLPAGQDFGLLSPNHTHPDVVRYLVDQSLWWADRGLAGMRYDVATFYGEVNAFGEPDPPGWWGGFNSLLRESGSEAALNFFTVGEVIHWNDGPWETRWYVSEGRMDGHKLNILHDQQGPDDGKENNGAMKRYFMQKWASGSEFLSDDRVYFGGRNFYYGARAVENALFRRYTDEVSGTKFGNARMFYWLTNHDRPRFLTDAFAITSNYDIAVGALRGAMTFGHAWTQIPMIYNGDEIGMYGTSSSPSYVEGGERGSYEQFIKNFGRDDDILKMYQMMGFLRRYYATLRKDATDAGINIEYLYEGSYSEPMAFVRTGSPNILYVWNNNAVNSDSANINVSSFAGNGDTFVNAFLDNDGNVCNQVLTVSGGHLLVQLEPHQAMVLIHGGRKNIVTDATIQITRNGVPVAEAIVTVEAGDDIFYRMTDSNGELVFNYFFEDTYTINVKRDAYEIQYTNVYIRQDYTNVLNDGVYVNNPPNIPNIVLPENEAHIELSDLRFEWTFNDADAGDYQTKARIQISSDSSFSVVNIIFDTTIVTSNTNISNPFNLTTEDTYFWRVKVFDSFDSPSVWSSYSSFYIYEAEVTITIDGRLVWGEWPAESIIPAFGIASPHNFRFTSDDDNFYFAMERGSPIGQNDRFVLYIDVDDNLTGSNTGQVYAGVNHSIPFKANYMIIYNVFDNLFELRHWNGSSWVNVEHNAVFARRLNFGHFEIKLPKSSVGSPDNLNLLFTIVDNSNNFLWGVAPNSNRISTADGQTLSLTTYLSYPDVNNISDFSNRRYYRNNISTAVTVDTRPLFTPAIDGTKDARWGNVPFITSPQYALPGGSDLRGDDNWDMPDGLVSDVYITNDLNYLYLGWKAQGDHYEYEIDGSLASAHYAFLIFTDTSPAGVSHDPWISGKTTRVINNLPDFWITGYVTYGADDFGILQMYKNDNFGNWELSRTLVQETDYRMSVYDNRWGEMRLPLEDLNLQPDDIVGVIKIARHSENNPGITDIGPWQSNVASDWALENAVIDGSKAQFYRIGQSFVPVFHRPADQPVAGRSIMRDPLTPYSVDNVNIRIGVSADVSVRNVSLYYSTDSNWTNYSSISLEHSFVSGGNAYYEGILPPAESKDVNIYYYVKVAGLSGIANYIYGNDTESFVTADVNIAQNSPFSYSILNSPPTKPTVIITPTSPSLNENLTATASGSVDVDAGDTITYIFNWYKNGVHQSEFDVQVFADPFQSVIDSGVTEQGQVWTCRVYAFDGTDSSVPGISNSIRFSEFVDWSGTPPTDFNAASISNNEWIWNDALDDHRKLGNNHENHDIKEVRISFDTEYVIFMVSLQNITDIYLPHIAVAIDTDNISTNDNYMLGDDSKLFIGNNYFDSATPNVQIAVHSVEYLGEPIIEIKYNNNNWQDVSDEDYQLAFDKDVNTIEWKIKRETLTLPSEGFANFRIASFRNRLGRAADINSTASFSNVDALDIITINGFYGLNPNYNDKYNNNTVAHKEFFNWKSDFYFGINYDVNGITAHTPAVKITNPMPDEGITIDSAIVDLGWTASTEDTVTSYMLELNNTDDFSGNVIYRVNLHKDSNYFVIPAQILDVNNTYYWRVRARDVSGVLSDYDVWWFYYEGIPPIYVNAPIDLNNIDNYGRIQGNQSASAQINWHWAPAIHTANWNIQNYEIQISDTFSFDNVIIHDTITRDVNIATFYQISPDSVASLERGKTYYARIRAGDTASPQNWSDWSESSNGIYLNLKELLSRNVNQSNWFSSDTYTKNTAEYFGSPYYSGTWFDDEGDHRMDRGENAHLDLKEFHVSTDKHNMYIYLKFYGTYASGYHFVQIPVAVNRNSDIRAFRGDRGSTEDSFTSAEATWNYLIQIISGQNVAFVWDNSFQTTGVGRFEFSQSANAIEVSIPLSVMGGNQFFKNNDSVRLTPAVFFNDNGNVGMSGAGSSNIVDCITNENPVWDDVHDRVIDYFVELQIDDNYFVSDFKGVNVSWTPAPLQPNPGGAPFGSNRDMIIYNVFVDRFWDGNPDNQPGDPNMTGGDFCGLIERAQYFNERGFNTLKLSAEAWFGGGAWGYNQHDIYRMQYSFVKDDQNEYRGFDCFVNLMKEMGYRNIGVGPDWVPGQIYGNESSGGTIENNPWMWHGERFGGRRILQYNADVRQFWVDNTRFLWSLGVVHLRVDNPKFYPDPAEQGYPFCTYWRRKTDKFAPDLYSFGEVPDGPDIVGAFCRDGNRFSGMLNMPSAYPIRQWAARGMNAQAFIDAIQGNEAAYYGGSVMPVMILFYNNHDYDRTFHFVGDNMSWDRSIGGMQNLMLYLMAMDGVPFWFYGDERAMMGRRELTYPGWQHTGNTGEFGQTREFAWDYHGATGDLDGTFGLATRARGIFHPLRWDINGRYFERLHGDNGRMIIRRGAPMNHEVVVLLNPTRGGHSFDNFYTHNANQEYRDWFTGISVWSDENNRIDGFYVSEDFGAYLIKGGFGLNKLWIRVVDSDSKPIEGAIVSINNQSHYTRETDADGYAFVDRVTVWEGCWEQKTVNIWKKGYMPYNETWNFERYNDDFQAEGTIVLESNDGVPPNTPIGLSAVSRDQSVVLNWAPSTDERGYITYDIFRSKGTNDNYRRIMEVMRNTYYDHDLDRKLENGVKYYYKIRARDRNDNVSDFSDEISVVPNPVQVTFQVDMSHSGLDVTQLYMKGNHRNISRSDFNTGYRMPDIDPILAMEHIGRGIWETTVELDPTININYIFVANHNDGNDWYDEHGFWNDYSYEDARGLTVQNPVSKKQVVTRRWMTAGPTNPQRPIGLTAIPRNESVRLGWSLNLEKNIDYYEIWRSTDGGDYQWIRNVEADVINFTDRGLTNGVQYSYRIKATNNFAYASDFSDAVSATPTPEPDVTPPSAPQNLNVISNGSNSVKLFWDYNTEGDLAGYNIYRATLADYSDSIRLNSTLISPSFTLTWIDKGIDIGQNYYYKVTALDDVFNESELSDSVPVKLARLTFKVDMGNIDFYNVSFTSTNIDYIGEKPGKMMTKAPDLNYTYTFTSDFIVGRTIRFKYAYNDGKELERNYSTVSRQRELTVPNVTTRTYMHDWNENPQRITDLKGQPDTGAVWLFWSPNTVDDDLAGYNVYYQSEDDNDWIRFNPVPVTDNFIRVTGLTNGTAYTFTVRSIDSGDLQLESDNSNTVNITPTGVVYVHFRN